MAAIPRTLADSRTQPTWALGWLSLAAAGATVVMLPPGWLTIVFAGLATLLLGLDRRLGWIPAGLLVSLAIPFGRGADLAPVTLGGWPLRPQDIAITVALVGALLAAIRGAGTRHRVLADGAAALVLAGGVFAAVGGMALAIGLMEGHVLRDVLRDARWWALYLAAPLAVLLGVRRDALLRGLLLGATAFAVLAVIIVWMPAFPGALKAGALDIDSGVPRVQYGNSIFLLPALAYATWRTLERRSLLPLAWVALLFGAQVLSITRTSILVSGGVVLLLIAVHAGVSRLGTRGGAALRTWRRPRLEWAAGAVVIGVVMVTTAVGAVAFSNAAASAGGLDPISRITFSEEGSDIDAIVNSGTSGGRLATYVNAWNVIHPSPVVGRGMGELVEVSFAWSSARAFTRGMQPGVDNAYLTVGMKAGGIGIAAMGTLLLLPLVAELRRRLAGRAWYVVAWLGILALTLTQSFAVTGYGPFGIALLAAVPFLPSAAPARADARLTDLARGAVSRANGLLAVARRRGTRPGATGIALLAAAALSVIALPAGWLTIFLSAAAVVALAADARLGWMPAALAVTVALPFARGADVSPLEIAGLPLRPHDLAVAIGLAAGLAQLLARGPARARQAIQGRGKLTFVIGGGVFLAVGAVAALMGIVQDNALRDVVRDVRWWGLYLAAPVAVVAGVSRASLLRGLLLGATAFAFVVAVASVAPTFEGGLKADTLFYDIGTPRMQFGNSIFLVPAVAYAAVRLARRPSWPVLGWTALLFGAQVLSLTRASILATLVVIVLAMAGYWLSRDGRITTRRAARATGAVLLAAVVGFVAAVGVAEYATATAAGPESAESPTRPPRQDPLGRITFTDEQSDVTVIVESVATGGRFASYLNAVHEIETSPVVGGGLGQLVDVAFAYNTERAFTIGKQPGVDNAYLTVALKAGAVGVAALGALLALPFLACLRRSRRHLRSWYLPAWLGVLALTLTQSFAVGSYGPFGLALLAAVPFLGYTRSSVSRAAAQR